MERDGSSIGEVPTGGGTQLRLFASLHVAAPAAEQLAQHASLLAERSDRVRALAAQDVHLTFAWLGDVAEEHLPVVAAALDDAAERVPGPTGCVVTGAARLGDDAVLAAEVDIELLAAVNAARDAFVDAVAPYAPAVDRRAWFPHVTMLRSRGSERMSDALGAQLPGVPAASWVARELLLHASLPAPMGRQYRLLHATLLGATAPVQG